VTQLVSDVRDLSAPVRVLDIERSFHWLDAGWQDFKRAPVASVACAAVPVVLGFLLTVGLVQMGREYLVVPLAAGFMLIGPMMAVGFYEISRALGARRTPTLLNALGAWRANFAQFALLGLVLALFMLVWLWVAMILFMLFVGDQPFTTVEGFVPAVLFTDAGIPLVIVGTAVGAVLAFAAFALSAVSFPMLLDREVGVLTAVATSLNAVTRNWRVMLGWGALIVLFVGAGFVTFFVGLLVTLPLIGHASWHAYRDLVGNGAVAV
jgi:uncharacterized membrane protein